MFVKCITLFLLVAVATAGECPGVCQPTSYTCPGSYESGLCPGSSSIKCCTEATPNCPGQCQQNDLSCNGHYESGECPGANDIQCCTSNGPIPAGSGTLGFDVSYWEGDVTTSSLQCLNDNGYVWACVEATRGSHNELNPYMNSVVEKCDDVFGELPDVYIFPDTDYDPADQIGGYVQTMLDDGVLDGTNRIWLDVEGEAYWSSSCSSNQNWLQTAIDTINDMYTGCNGRGTTCIAIYTSHVHWEPIMCDTTKFSNFDLWYAHYDNSKSFDDFIPFGGWDYPTVKQYNGDVNVCGINGIDLDYL